MDAGDLPDGRGLTMNRSHWIAAGVCVTGSLVILLGMHWFSDQLYPDTDPGRLAYKPVDDLPPRVDLASAQRGWPNNLTTPDARNQVVAYQRDVEGQVKIPAAVPGAVKAPAAPVDLGALLASADVNAGKAKAQVCASCHDFTQGGPNRIGPNLWGVAGRKIASHPGFAYSAAMSAQAGNWSYDRLFTYLESPARAVPGNKMGYAGMRRPEDRAALIKYLASLGSASPPFPAPQSGGGGSGGAAR